ncbi:uncharacterized protein MELLADRAFT_111312 [Melampsora larici-populina 98AG31]|uniref:Uncharacterized protein n=1 Tax=Melampsora larici-populina (strain 98AG31 / pathotype 3-4-7) TaxID=747676 RepID=F4S2R0_MELLP|nr:uncharacterized protein MELLADRAFT_111312 [Melampsora larici-populina 98AG31]EGG01082.1 hypothetical protein MELLADRAFT_111312 [Melampsora larici-populina 98AG31]
MFSNDVSNIIEEHERQKGQKEEGSISRGRGKATRGRGRGGRREATSEEEGNQDESDKDQGSDLTDMDDTEEKQMEKEEIKEQEEEEGGDIVEDDTISLGDEAEFVKEDAHVKREHKCYVTELLRLYDTGKVGKFQMLEKAYHGWCERVKSQPRQIEMLNCSSEEDKVDEPDKTKRKAGSQPTEKPAKIGKTMSQGKTLTHWLIDLSAYWDGKMAAFGWDLLSSTDDQITAITGGRMLSHLAPTGKSQSHHQSHHHHHFDGGVFHGSSTGSYVSHDYHDQGLGNNNVSNGNGRGQGRRGQGFMRGNHVQEAEDRGRW